MKFRRRYCGMRIGLVTATFAAGILQCAAQTAPAFDVASVKVSTLPKSGGKGAGMERIQVEPTSVTMRNVSMRSCIAWAFHLKDYQLSGPGWMDSERYDIVAKSAGVVPPDELRRMMQTLIAERFQLAAHREEQTLKVYALVPAKGGPKLAPSSDPGPASMKVSEGSLVFGGAAVADLADRLSAGGLFGLDLPVIDRTGLTGRYDFQLKLADSVQDLKRTMEAMDKEPDPARYTAALSALGLRLEPQRSAAQMLVVDHVEKVPAGN